MDNFDKHFVNKICSMLLDQGHQCTPTRRCLLQVLRKKSHIDVVEIQKLLIKDHNIKTSVQTIYASLKLFSELHLIVYKKIDGKRVYELRFKRDHIHLRCQDCMSVVESNDASLLKAIRFKCKDYGFIPSFIDVSLNGICKKCNIDNH